MLRAEFRDRVASVVKSVPPGKVVTYGQVAALIGMPRAARLVGQAAHWGDPEVPWQRVVNRRGGLASGYPGGPAVHAAGLAVEGVAIDENWEVNLAEHQWIPEPELVSRLELSAESLHYLEQRVPYASGKSD